MRLTSGVIFVCEWNTCRSAMAKYIFVDSAGCITEGNEPIGKRPCLTLQEQNIPLDDEHISKPFTIQKYNAFDCIIALDNRTLKLQKKFLSATQIIKFGYSRILTEKI